MGAPEEAAELLQAAASFAEQDSGLADGGSGLLVLAVLAAAAGELESSSGSAADAPNAPAILAGALAALERCRAAHAAGDASWAADCGLDALQDMAAEGARRAHPPVAETSEASSAGRPEGQHPAQLAQLLARLQRLHADALTNLVLATSCAPDAASLAAGLGAVSWVLALAPPCESAFRSTELKLSWMFLSRPSMRRSSAAGGSSEEQSRRSRAASRPVQEQQLQAPQGLQHAVSAQARSASQQQIASLLRSWGRLAAFAWTARGMPLFPPELVHGQAAAVLLNPSLPMLQRMEGARLLAAWHNAMQVAVEAEAEAWEGDPEEIPPQKQLARQCLANLAGGLLRVLSALVWALQPAQLDLLGLAEGAKRALQYQLLGLACGLWGASDALDLTPRFASSLPAAAAELFECVVGMLWRELDGLPPPAASIEEVAATCLALGEALEAGDCALVFCPRNTAARVIAHGFVMLGFIDFSDISVDALRRSRLLDLLIEALLRYPDPVLVELAGRLVADKAPSCSGEKDFVALFDAESFGVFADVGRNGYAVLLQRAEPDSRPSLVGLSSVLAWIHEQLRVPEDRDALAMNALCLLIKAVARLPGMTPPCQLWQLLSAAGHLCRSSDAARKALAECDVAVETTMALVALLRMASDRPEVFDSEAPSDVEHVENAMACAYAVDQLAKQPELLQQLRERKADAALLRALQLPHVPNLAGPTITCCYYLLVKLAVGSPAVAARLLDGGAVGRLVQPLFLWLADRRFQNDPDSSRVAHGIQVVALGAALAFYCTAIGGVAVKRQGAHRVPDTARRFGFDWRRLLSDTAHAVMVVWRAALHPSVIEQRISASAMLESLGMLGLFNATHWALLAEADALERAQELTEIGALAARGLHQQVLFGRKHFSEHAVGCLGCRYSFTSAVDAVVGMVEEGLRCDLFVKLSLAHSGLQQELSAAAGLLQQFFKEPEWAALLERCQAAAKALAAAEATVGSAAQLKSQRQQRCLEALGRDKPAQPPDRQQNAEAAQRLQTRMEELRRREAEQERQRRAAEPERLRQQAEQEQRFAALLAEEEAAEQQRNQKAERRKAAAEPKRQHQRQQELAEAERRQREEREEEERQRQQAEEQAAQRQRAAQAEQERRWREAAAAAAAARRAAEAAAQRAAEQKGLQALEHQQQSRHQQGAEPQAVQQAAAPLPAPPPQPQQAAPAAGPEQQTARAARPEQQTAPAARPEQQTPPALESSLAALQLQPATPGVTGLPSPVRLPGQRPLPYRPPMQPSPQQQQQQQQHPGPAMPAVLAAMLPGAVVPAHGAARPQPQGQHTADSRGECSVCLDAAPVAVAVPCGHRTLCAGCAALMWRRGVRECVICRSALQALYVPGHGPVA